MDGGQLNVSDSRLTSVCKGSHFEYYGVKKYGNFFKASLTLSNCII